MVFAAAMRGDGIRDVITPGLKGGMGSFSNKKIRKITDKYTAFQKAKGIARSEKPRFSNLKNGAFD